MNGGSWITELDSFLRKIEVIFSVIFFLNFESFCLLIGFAVNFL